MNSFADRLIDAVRAKGNPCVVGLDPRIEQMPDFATEPLRRDVEPETVRDVIAGFHRLVIEAVAPIVPAIKPQIAFFEQYGIGGLLAFEDTIRIAQEYGLLVIADAKRSDIASTAEAYAHAFLGPRSRFDGFKRGYGADALTLTPFLGRDSLQPFMEACDRFGAGAFVLVKTSNKGSADLQDLKELDSREPVYTRIADMVNALGRDRIGTSGYSSVGAVVGATFPEQAVLLRAWMPSTLFLVPGYGAQGGTARDAAHCFNPDGLGAVVNASRSIVYAFDRPEIDERDYVADVQRRVAEMADDLNAATRDRAT